MITVDCCYSHCKQNKNLQFKSISFIKQELLIEQYCFHIRYLLIFHVDIIAGKSFEQILTGIKKPNTPFSNDTINQFIELVREKSSYDMIDVRSYSQPEKYPRIDNKKKDIQILYSSSGYYVCTYFDPVLNTIYIYDTMSSNKKFKIVYQHYSIILNRYPRPKPVYVIPKTEQYDDTSNGPLVISYATTLVLGENPATYGFRMNTKHKDKAIHLREHIFEMLRTRKLSPFPR